MRDTVNNFKKISSAVLLLAACLGLTACEQKTYDCIGYAGARADMSECKPDAPKKDKPDCLGGEDFICMKPNSNNVSRELSGAPW
jgi:hypothetical protein